MGEIRLRLAAVARRLGRPRVEPGVVFAPPLLALGLVATVLSAAAFLSGADAAVALAMRGEPAGVRAFLDVATDVGLILWYFYPALFLALVLLATRVEPASLRRRHRLGRLFVMNAWFAASLGAATSITHAIKYLLGRARPELLDSHGTASFELFRLGSAFESFPSGHSNNMGVVSVALAVWFPALRWPALLLGACFALTRLPVEAHFLSDIVAGSAIGALTALALARVLALRRIVYRVDAGGLGWRGLLPYRSGATS